MALLLLPFVGMAWARAETTTEDRSLVAFPEPMTDGAPNVAYLSELGTWFNDHFAYRSLLVSANARLRANLLGVSGNSQVIVGSEGWLYYRGSLNDYVGTDIVTPDELSDTARKLTDRELANVAHNTLLMQRYVEAQGAQFLLVIAPNKNTLYPEYMPSWYIPSAKPTNLERLVPLFDTYGVNYLDLTEVLKSSDSPLYLKRDTHWNNKGAYYGYDVIAAELGLTPLLAPKWSARVDRVGDLDTMLYPDAPTLELQFYAPGINDGPGSAGSAWAYTGDARAVTDDFIEATGAGEGVVLVFRDSFGDSLLPYMAAGTERSYFSKLIPYNSLQVVDLQAGYVLVERAERHLNYLAETAPIALSPAVKLNASSARDERDSERNTTIETGTNGSLVSISGVIDPGFPLAASAKIYVGIEGTQADGMFFEAFGTSPDELHRGGGYLIYLPDTLFDLDSDSYTIKLFVAAGDELVMVESVSYDGVSHDVPHSA